jgi:hypothetical protein
VLLTVQVAWPSSLRMRRVCAPSRPQHETPSTPRYWTLSILMTWDQLCRMMRAWLRKVTQVMLACSRLLQASPTSTHTTPLLLFLVRYLRFGQGLFSWPYLT